MQELAGALTAGDADLALTLLMHRYGATVYRYCRRMLGDDDDGDDVSQIVFMQAFEAIQRGSRVDNVRAWLLGVARHRCLDRLKGRRRAPILVDADDLERSLESDTRADSPVHHRRAAAAVEDCLDELDARSRKVVLLRFHDQLSYEEIARLTGDRPGALRVRVARALRAMRLRLERKGGIP